MNSLLSRILVSSLILSAALVRSEPTVGTWAPIFVGIDQATGSCAERNPRVMKVNVLRVDTKSSGIRFITDSRCDQYLVDVKETRRIPTRLFLTSTKAKVAVNGDFFDPNFIAYLPSYTNILHLGVSEGVVVSPANGGASLLVTRDNRASILGTTPNTSLKNVWTAISGSGLVLVDGVPLEGDAAIHPRTGIGLSKDSRYVFLMTIDGRQPGFSDGATTKELGEWLARFGAYQGLNLDGGGSTTMVKIDYDGKPALVNRPVGWGDPFGSSLPGRERFVGNSLGVYANELPKHSK